jgi:uncharacterized membrane protein
VTATGGADPTPSRPVREERVALGILYMLGATVMFSSTSAAAKWLVATYPPGEVLFFRQVMSLLVCALIVLPAAGMGVFRTARLRDHGVRSAIQGGAQLCLLIAFTAMPLASAMAINFSSPLFATLLSAIFLREAVGLARALALTAGFAGVLIVTEPGAGTFQVAALFALANAVMYGSIATVVRGMSATESDRDADHVSDGAPDAAVPAASAVRIRDADAARCDDYVAVRRGQRHRAISLDASHHARADLGRNAVLLLLAGVGDDPWLRDLGRHSNRRPADRLRDRRRLRPVSVVAGIVAIAQSREMRPQTSSSR